MILKHVPLRTGERRIFRALFLSTLAIGQAAASGRPPLVLHDDIACLVYAYFQRILSRPECRSAFFKLAGLQDLELSDGLPARGEDTATSPPPAGFTLTVTLPPLNDGAPRVAHIRYVVPVQHACAHKCQWALGAEASFGAAWCGECAEWANRGAGIGARSGALRNAGPGAYATGWASSYAQYNMARNAKAAEWLLSQLGRALIRRRDAETNFNVALAAEIARRPAGTNTEGAVMMALNVTALDLAMAGRDGLEGGPGRRGASLSETTKWVRRVEERDSLAAIIDAVAPAAIGARHNTRNIALREAAVAAEVDAALRLAQLHFPLGAKALSRRQAGRARNPDAADLSDYAFAQEVLKQLTECVNATRPAIYSSQAVFDSFKCAYVEACALAVRLHVEAQRTTTAGRVRVGERAAKACESKLVALRKSLQEQLTTLRLFQPHVESSAVRAWSVPTLATALLPGAFPSQLGRTQLTDAAALAPLLHLRNRRDRLREHTRMLRASIKDAISNCDDGIAALHRIVTALTLPQPDLTALADSGIKAGGLFASALREPVHLAAAGARGAAEGARRLASTRLKFQRLAKATALVHDDAELRVVGSGRGELKGRSVWERRGPAMLRGDMTVEAWATAVVVAPSVGADGAERASDSDSEGGSDDSNGTWGIAPDMQSSDSDGTSSN